MFSFNRDKAIVIDSVISNCGTDGIRAWDAKLIGSTLSGNGIGARLGGSLRAIDSQIVNNIGEGARAGTSPFKSLGRRGDKVLISGSTVSGNGTGVVFSELNESRMKARNSTFEPQRRRRDLFSGPAVPDSRDV